MRWNTETGEVSGLFIEVRTMDFEYKGYTHPHPAGSQHAFKSDKTDHVAAHKGSSLRKII